ncbi:MAG: pyruvate kinase [Oscillibacter sp.]|nr:pyruvate kinase [Oscillibacter sp.]
MILYGTLGGSCQEHETVRALFRAGMTGARLNLSHGPLDAFADALTGFWSAAEEEGIRPRLVIDLQGPELRAGRLSQPVPLAEGGRAVLVREGGSTGPAVSRIQHESVPAGAEILPEAELAAIPVPKPVLDTVRPGDLVSLDDSALLLEVLDADSVGAECRVLRGGTLLSRKSLAVLGKTVPMPPLTAEDEGNLSQAVRFGVTDILQPFVRGRSDVEALRAALVRAGAPGVRIMAKIENRQGLDRLDEIADAADEICIARGDLGNGLPLWEVPRYQKRIAAHCRAVGRPFCVATQLLWSMQTRSVPTRAEMCDIYNAVLDGASGLMLTGETAAGQYPAEAMAYLARAARTAMEDMEER